MIAGLAGHTKKFPALPGFIKHGSKPARGQLASEATPGSKVKSWQILLTLGKFYIRAEEMFREFHRQTPRVGAETHILCLNLQESEDILQFRLFIQTQATPKR